MLNQRDIQIMLKQKGISQRELVRRSGLSESVVSTLIKQMPVLLPHLIDVLGKNPFGNEPVPEGDKMADALLCLSNLKKRSISDPVCWQEEARADRDLPERR